MKEDAFQEQARLTIARRKMPRRIVSPVQRWASKSDSEQLVAHRGCAPHQLPCPLNLDLSVRFFPILSTEQLLNLYTIWDIKPETGAKMYECQSLHSRDLSSGWEDKTHTLESK